MIKSAKQYIFRSSLLMVFLINVNLAFSQSLPELSSQTPQAAALSKYSEYPVSTFTGVPDISVPLYTIQSGDISLPIGLNYHAGGFRVSEEASWVGLGWTLTANGVITRTVNGADDFNGSVDHPGWAYHHLGATPKIIDIVRCTGALSTGQPADCNQAYVVGGGNNFIVGNERLPDYSGARGSYPLVDGIMQDYSHLAGANFDWEADIYSINILGLNAKFVLDQEQNVYFLDKQDAEIKKTANGWAARTNDGFQYYFERKETTHTLMSNNEVNGSWYVTKIISPTKREMNFIYEEDTFFSYQKTYSESARVVPNGYQSADPSYHETKTKNVYLSRIEFDNGYVTFTTDGTLREDIKDAKKLKTIKIYNSNNLLIKEFELITSYFTSDISGRNGFMPTFLVPEPEYSYYKKRLRLDGVIDKGATLPTTTQFNYSEVNLPVKDSFSQDFWGFYHGRQSNTLMPSHEGVINFKRVPGNYLQGLVGCGIDIQISETRHMNLIANNRNPNPSTVGANILKEIIYPTGGKTSFTFESNDYNTTAEDQYEYENFSKNVRKLGRPNEPDQFDPSPTLTFDLPSYSLGLSDVSLQLVLLNYGGTVVTNGNTFVEISSPNFPTSRYYANPTTGQTSYTLDITLPSTIQGPITLSLDGVPELDVNQTAILTFNCRVKKQIGTKIGPGLRIQEIRHSDATNSQNDIIKSYSYNSDQATTTSGILKTPVRFMSSTPPSVATNCDILIYSSSSNLNTLSLSQSALLGYTTVTENLGQNGESGKTVFSYHNSRNITVLYEYLPAGSPNAVSYLLDGKLKSKRVYDSQNKIVYEETNSYERKYEKIIKSIHQDGFAPEYASFIGNGGFHYYPIYSTWEPLTSTLKRTYNLTDNNYIETLTTYAYNSENLQPSIITTSDSKAGTSITKNYYPNDVDQTNYTTVLGEGLTFADYNSFNQLKRIKDQGGLGDYKTAQPVQVETYSNSTLLSRQRTTYSAFGNLTLPNFVKYSKNANLLENRISYDNYDDKGNPIELKMTGGTPVVYIWGYQKTLPIAKIENATYTEVSPYVANLQSLSNTGTEAGLVSALNNLRANLPHAMVTTFTHKPLIGVSTITDPKGMTSYYTYDAQNRLQYIKDHNSYILQKYCYNYKGQQIDCATGSPATIYTNVAQSSSFTKQGCGSGTTPSSVVYSVPAGIYSSTISQADANSKAAADIAANGQSFANANGTCILLPPAAPTGLSQLSAAPSVINFSWAPVPGATGYKYFRDGGTPVTTTGTSASFSGLAANTSYAIGVLAYNASGDGLSSIVSMSTTVAAPTGLSRTSATASSLNFSWSAVTGATSYKIYRNGTYISTVTGTTGSLSGLSASTAYSIQVLASNTAGDSPLSPAVSMSTTLGAPANLALTSATSSSINFSWTAVAGATGYKIYKNSDPAITTTATSGSFSGLTPSTNYSIRVLAYNASGDGTSTLVSMSTASLPAPTGLSFTSATASSINFSWTAVAGATSYKIYSNGTYISTVTGTTGSLSGLTIATAYSVQVRASYQSSDGALSAAVSMATKLGAPTGLSQLSAAPSVINFSWAPVPGATGYKYFRDGGTPVTTTGTSASFSGLAANTSYAIGVLAYNASGDGLSSIVSMSTTVAAPTGLSLTSATASSLNFSWSAVTGATSYKIYRNGTYISTVTGTTGSLSGLSASTAYNVQVLASNTAGDSPLTPAVSMSTSASYTNKGTITNNTGSSAIGGTVVIKANGNTVASFTMPSLANGATFEFSSTYSMPITSNGTFVIQLLSQTGTVSYVYMNGGSTSPNAFFSNISGGLQATVNSPGPQYQLSFIIK